MTDKMILRNFLPPNGVNRFIEETSRMQSSMFRSTQAWNFLSSFDLMLASLSGP